MNNAKVIKTEHCVVMKTILATCGQYAVRLPWDNHLDHEQNHIKTARVLMDLLDGFDQYCHAQSNLGEYVFVEILPKDLKKG